jgi:hypothetical protein
MVYHEHGRWYMSWKFWGLVTIALVVTAVCFCFFFSMKDIPTWNLVPDSAFAFMSVNINEDDRGTATLLDSVEEWMRQNETGWLKRFIIKRALYVFLPERIVAIAVAGSEAKPETLVIVKMGSVIRLAKLFPGQIDRAFFERQDFKEERIRGHHVKYADTAYNRMGLSAYTIIGKSLVAGSSYAVLQDALTGYPSWDTDETRPQHLTPLFLRGSDQQNLFLFADNGARDLSKIVSYIEEKYAFAPFPSMDAVEMVYGNISISEEQVSGQITFLSNDAGRLREVRSDVKYIYGAMRRKLKASNIELEGDVQTEGSQVQFDFRVPDHINTMINYLNAVRGESE